MADRDTPEPVPGMAAGGMPSIMSPARMAEATQSVPEKLRSFDDHHAVRHAIFDRSLRAAQAIEPIANTQFKLHLSDVGYEGPETYSLEEQKRAILEGRTLSRPLRGTWQLHDLEKGKQIGTVRSTIARIPWYTERGTFIISGNEHSLAHQMRLRPGVFSREKDNGEIESHANVIPGQGGTGHRYFLDPKTGIFKLSVAQSEVPIMPLLRAFGSSDEELSKLWGPELMAANRKHDNASTFSRLYQKIVRKRVDGASEADKQKAVMEELSRARFDPTVNQRTLGRPFDTLNKEALHAITDKLLKLSRREVDPDDRDHMANQNIMGPEDLISERISRSKQKIQQMLWQVTRRARLDPAAGMKAIQPGFLDGDVLSAITDSGVGMLPEGTNPLEMLDLQTRVTRMGVGGIPSTTSIPDEARNVQPSHLNMIDLLRTPESLAVGVDSRFAAGAMKDSNSQTIKAPYRDARTGKVSYMSPEQIDRHVVAHAGEMAKPNELVYAQVGGKTRKVPRETVDYEIPHMENTFSSINNLVPMKSAIKGQRAAMASRFFTQTLPLLHRESPLVRTAVPGTGGELSYEEALAHHVGALQARVGGRVEKVDQNGITVKYDDGKTETHGLYNYHPNARKTYLHQEATVGAGDRVEPGQLMAKSNFTDDKGHVAMGLNARVCWHPGMGDSYEDAFAIRRGFADQMSSLHLYQHGLDIADNHRVGKKNFTSIFAGEYDRKQLGTMDDDGVVKPGTRVQPGDPLILAAAKREATAKTLYSSHKGNFANQSVLWDHHDEGIVTDVAKTKKGYRVTVRSVNPMVVGDKMCYDDQTDILTREGWKPIWAVTLQDELCVLDPATGVFHYEQPTGLHLYQSGGRMYRIKSQQVDLFVTDNHRMYVKLRGAESFTVHQAKEIAGKRVQYSKAGEWVGVTPENIYLPAMTVRAGQSGNGTREMPAIRIQTKHMAALIGAYVSDGNCFAPKNRGGGIEITQKKPGSTELFMSFLEEAGLHGMKTNDKIRIHGNQFEEFFRRHCGSGAENKRLPAFVFDWDRETQAILFKWLMWGDGHSKDGRPIVYTTVSKKLADDVQRLCLHIGYAANIIPKNPPAKLPVINGRQVKTAKQAYSVRIVTAKLEPTVNHGHAKTQHVQQEEFVEDYQGSVHCVTVSTGIVYVRRNGIPVWSGNTNRHANKGVISKILEDDEMPHDKDGKPFDVMFNPLGVISRMNPATAIETQLAMAAEARGKPYNIEDFSNITDLTEYAQNEAKKYGIPETETIHDPRTGKAIPGVATGKMFMLKLSHTAESKGQARGLGSYSSMGEPAKTGGAEGSSKRFALQDLAALASHGAYKVLEDVKLVKGQKNPAYWSTYMGGGIPNTPDVPLVYQQFTEQLRAAGINVKRHGNTTRLMALRDKDVDELAEGRELQNAETVDWDDAMKPVKGGLFDEGLTGSHGGKKWSQISLPEPMVNPVYEDPVRHMLGLTKEQLRQTLAGTHKLANGETGPHAVRKALSNIDVGRELVKAREDVRVGRGAARDKAVKRLGYLKMLQDTDATPADYMISKVPVLPPLFRPVSQMTGNGATLVHDANVLYKELFEAKEALKSMTGRIEDTSEERMAVYDAMKAVVGLGDPINPKTKDANIKGFLRSVLGDNPKHGLYQQKLLGTNMDLVGRAVVTPNPELSIDEVGLPEARAWEVYTPFVVRRLVRQGMPRVQALEHASSRTKLARKSLIAEMDERPVLVNRAPVLHKFGHMAFFPRLVKGDTLHVSPMVVQGFGMDFDGDTSNYSVPAGDAARDEAVRLMLPSRNLLSPSDMKSPMFVPIREHAAGLYAGTAHRNLQKKPRVFASGKEAYAALIRGEIDPSDPVTVLDHKK